MCTRIGVWFRRLCRFTIMGMSASDCNHTSSEYRRSVAPIGSLLSRQTLYEPSECSLATRPRTSRPSQEPGACRCSFPGSTACLLVEPSAPFLLPETACLHRYQVSNSCDSQDRRGTYRRLEVYAVKERPLSGRTAGSVTVSGTPGRVPHQELCRTFGPEHGSAAGSVRVHRANPRWVITSSFFPKSPLGGGQQSRHVATRCRRREPLVDPALIALGIRRVAADHRVGGAD